MSFKRLVAFDVGSHTIGIAKSDVMKTIAQPVKTMRVQENMWPSTFEEINKLVDFSSVEAVIIGLPLHMDNSMSPSAERAQRFEKSIKKYFAKNNFDIETKMLDERLTTVQAENILVSADVSRKKRKNVIDTMAAVLILQNYL